MTSEELQRRDDHIDAMINFNDPREDPTAWSHYDGLLDHLDIYEPLAAEILRHGPPSVEKLAAIIRKVDVNHDKGAAELAELILKELGA